MAQRIVIIGGLSAGPAAAAKARRMSESAEILLFEKDTAISYATCGMPYALSKKIAQRENLIVVKPELLEQRFNIKMHLGEEVIKVDPVGKFITTPQGQYSYDTLIFATGARPVLPPIEGIKEAANKSFLRTLDDFDRLMGKDGLVSAQKVTILGAGLIGVEIAENLRHIGKEVVIVEGTQQILPMYSEEFALLAEEVLVKEGIRVETGQFATTFNGKILTLQDGTEIETDYLMLSTGIKPVTELLTEHGAEVLGNGALIVNDQMQTSLPDIYAAGDCVAIPNPLTKKPGYFPLGTHSNKGGRTAAINATGGSAHYKGGYGTAIVQVFDYTLARTGLSSKEIYDSSYNPESSFIYAGATPGYYPGKEEIALEIIFDKKSGKLLSAEAWGKKGVDKRIDVLSTALYAGLTIDDLHDLDLAYAPPFSPAKDPIVVAGYVASNQNTFGYRSLTPNEFMFESTLDEAFVVDVRTAHEFERGAIEGAKNIPLDNLRDHLIELPKDLDILVYCQKGMRGYIASQILANEGFNVKNLAGGYGRLKL
ncbi:MAG: FAD-dependent oxidoreductase [Fibrobacterales bacterium]